MIFKTFRQDNALLKPEVKWHKRLDLSSLTQNGFQMRRSKPDLRQTLETAFHTNFIKHF